jgi:hypothetical protein
MNLQPLSAETPYLVLRECEPDGQGGQAETTTILLTASGCPIGCSMCDLHRYTLPSATEPGSIPRQLDSALSGGTQGGRIKPGGWIKLYNSGNFFDPRSIPPSDYVRIADACQGFSRVIVENHPRFGGARLARFRDLLSARLEVAVGLETVQPRWLKRLGKQISRDDFDRYARWLRQQGVDLRVFLIAGAPGITVRESIRWARLSTRHAVAHHARHISLIPARRGEGWQGRADELPRFALNDLADLLGAAIADAGGRAAVTIDLWDLDPGEPWYQVLRTMNLTQQVEGRG